MTVWLVRAGDKGAQEQVAIERGAAVIDWDELGDVSGVDSREEFERRYREAYPTESGNALANRMRQVWSFVKEIQVGDLVVLPLKTISKTVAIGHVTGPYEYRLDFPEHARSTHPVEWIRTDIPRDDLDIDLLHSLGALPTVCRIERNDAQARLEAVAGGAPDPGSPEPLQTDQLDRRSADSARRVIESIYPDEDLRLRVLGLLVELIGQANQAGPNCWELTLRHKGFLLNVGPAWSFSGNAAEIDLLLDSTKLKNIRAQLEEIADVRPGNLKRLHNELEVRVPVDRLAELQESPLYEDVKAAQVSMIQAAGRKVTYSRWSKAHSEGLVQYLRDSLGVDLPDPEYASRDVDRQRPIDLRSAFEAYRQRPGQSLSLSIRRMRARQIRELLSDPGTITPEAFNREVWDRITAVELDGQDVKGEIEGALNLDAARIAQFENAILQGRLQYHGNSVWGSASRVYAPMIKDPEQKLANVRQAAGILNNSSLTPRDKALRVWSIPGFGANISTGLVMLFHPEDFGLFNQKTAGALKKIGREPGPIQQASLDQFEDMLTELKDELGATDFLELDEFLEQLNRTWAPGPIADILPPLGEPSRAPSYSLEQISQATSIDVDELERWTWAIQRKGQAILYGPPGTGKTYVAQLLARHLTDDDPSRVQLIQFHPAYAYEDFMQGIRPRTTGGERLSYVQAPGRFLQFCQAAAERDGTFVLIIDEINRANLPEVFGELMYLLEYRDREVPLAGGTTFRIPHNVQIIGTMNTADRSIALVDFALRRRFAFLRLAPKYDVLQRFHQDNGVSVTALIDVLEDVNRAIDDPNYELGVSFFLTPDLAIHLEDIWQMEIYPYLEEFFVNKPDQAHRFRWSEVSGRVLSTEA